MIPWEPLAVLVVLIWLLAAWLAQVDAQERARRKERAVLRQERGEGSEVTPFPSDSPDH